MRTPIILVLLFTLLSGCGGGANPPDCTGTSCICPAGQECNIGSGDCAEQSCSLDCSNDNVCSGECGQSCSIDCTGGSTCEVTVGPSGSVTCSGGSTCDITCTGSCSVSCDSTSTCTLKCAGDDAPHSIPEGGSCQ